MTSEFVHLRVHSEYSLVDGVVRVKSLCKSVAAMGMPAVALTDLCNFYALIKFQKAAQSAGLKPIFGADFFLKEDEDSDQVSSLCLLAQNVKGYKNLTELISRAYLQGQHLGKAYIFRSWVEELNEGLIVLSGARDGDVGQLLVGGKQDLASAALARWQGVFGDRYYLELQRTGRQYEEDYIHAAASLAAQSDCPVVATNDVRFLESDEFEAHEARVCIRDGRALDDPRRPRSYSDQQYLRSPDEMLALFADIPEALQNSVEIAKRCNLEIELGTYYLPEYPIPEGMTQEVFFRKLCHDGLTERLEFLFDPNAPTYPETEKEYRERLDFELNIILQMGFPGYFLIVMDFIQWAKDNAIPVGPGRGSGAGSLVAYALKITDLDPIEYDLLFERFLNPERVSMPDFDVDFCMEGRDRVISYVADNYGRDAVSQIITFGTMAAKAVVRDVARVQGKSYGLADKLSKLIPFEVGITLEKAFEQEGELRDFLAADEQAQEIWDMAQQLEGVVRGVGKHAGGVVIAPSKLTDFAPLYCDESGAGLVTQFDKNDVEDAGLVKFDFLGLRTLTIIDWALKIINAQRSKVNEQPLDIMAIPLEDVASFDLLKKAETTAVFQLESRGMKDLIKRLLPDCFEDIIALVALFRPGPLQSGMVDDFINRKHGRAELAYPHPQYQHDCLKPILGPTYGIILYQEQVMQIAQEMGGYTLGGADLLRRAMGKKKPEEMEKQRVLFMEGAVNKGFDKNLASNIFDLMEKFAGYGFNKSHSAAYALVSYQTAWLKTHYPAPFMAAVMSSELDNTDKIVIFIEECRDMKLEYKLPSVNEGEYMFTVNDRGQIVYGLGAIKGLGEGPVENIIAARNAGGDFKNLFDFCERTDPRKVNKRAIEALIRAGAFDDLGEDRAVLMAAMGEAVQGAEQSAKNAESGMVDLFGDTLAVDNRDVYQSFRSVRRWNTKERLQGEKDTLGLYVTGHPIDDYEDELRRFVPRKIVDLNPDKQAQTIAGLVVNMRTMKNKRGDTMAFVQLDDRTARIEVALFSDSYESNRDKLLKDTVLVVEGICSFDEYSGGKKMRVKSVRSLAEAREQNAKELVLSLSSDRLLASNVEQLKGALTVAKGGRCPVVVQYQRPEGYARLRFGEEWKILPKDELLQRLRDDYGTNNVVINYE
ncbi:DNA-directed DNA polymerase III PolC [Spongiibacter sp. IMCC21906]|uniref:DNA polymerase III subunit alpha n=1 Tax=Spongiibacter sp. IMCC21906 TaxID=1620392 RepID=UPI00062DD8E5|nr:DNA polymerase III subunit alpha [Spongiibacter sp. IMCC21906]AKH70273.1 DNA-directed DNA polymerase III PolC [Spongiibacter sp. IMCC21906]